MKPFIFNKATESLCPVFGIHRTVRGSMTQSKTQGKKQSKAAAKKAV